MENNQNDVLQRFGGRKFVLSLILIIAIVALASLAPASLNTEVVVALLGVLATFSGSNAFLSRLALRGAAKQSGANDDEVGMSIPQQETAPKESNVTQIQADNLPTQANNLEARVTQIEIDQGQLIEIIKQMQNVISSLTTKNNMR